MKRFVTIIVIAILISSSSFLLFGCSKGSLNPNDIDYIEFRDNSLKLVYDVDEKLDYNNIFIVVVLKDNKGDIVEKVLPSMMEGFDSSTTTGPVETRAMRAKYMGFYTTPWNYRVVNNYDINTKARLKLEENTQGEAFEVSASLDTDELANIKGMMMDISYDTTKIVRQGDIEINIEGWELSIRSIREGSFSVLYYARPFSSPIDNDTDLFVLAFEKIGSGDPNIEIKNIILSDGDTDIHLPDVKLNN